MIPKFCKVYVIYSPDIVVFLTVIHYLIIWSKQTDNKLNIIE